MGRRQAGWLLLIVLGVSCLSWTGIAQATNTQPHSVGSRQYSPRQAPAQGAVHRRLLDSTAPAAAAAAAATIGAAAVTGPAAAAVSAAAAAAAAGAAGSAAAQPAAGSTAGKAASDAALAAAPANAAAPAVPSQASSTPQQQQQVTAQAPTATTPKADTAPVAPRWIPPSERHAILSAGTSVGNLPAAPHAGPATDSSSSSSSKSDATKPADQAPKLDSSMTGTKVADSAPMVSDRKVPDQAPKPESITVTAQLVNSAPAAAAAAAADSKVAGQAQDAPKPGSTKTDDIKPIDGVPVGTDSKQSEHKSQDLQDDSSKDSTKPVDSVAANSSKATKAAEQGQESMKQTLDSSKDSTKPVDSVAVDSSKAIKAADQTQEAVRPSIDSSKDSAKPVESVAADSSSKATKAADQTQEAVPPSTGAKPVDSMAADSSKVTKAVDQEAVKPTIDSSKDSTKHGDSVAADSSKATKAADQAQEAVTPSIGTRPVDSTAADTSKATKAADQVQEIVKPSLDSSKDSSAKPVDSAAAAARSSTASQADSKLGGKDASMPVPAAAPAAADSAGKQDSSSSSSAGKPFAGQPSDKPVSELVVKPALKAEAAPAAAAAAAAGDSTAKQDKPTTAQHSADTGSKPETSFNIGSAPAPAAGAAEKDLKSSSSSSSSSSSKAKSEATKPVVTEQPAQKVDNTPAAIVPATQLDSSSSAAPKQTLTPAPQDKPQSAGDTTQPAKPAVTNKAPRPETDSAPQQVRSSKPKVAEIPSNNKAPVQETKVAPVPATESVTAPPKAVPAAAPAVPAAAPKGPLKDKAGRTIRKPSAKNSSRSTAPGAAVPAPKQGSTAMKYSWIVPSATVPAADKAALSDISSKAAPVTVPTHGPDSSSSSNDKAAQPHSTSAEGVLPVAKQPEQQVAESTPKAPTMPAAAPQPAPAAAPTPAPASSSSRSEAVAKAELAAAEAKAAQHVQATVQPQDAAKDGTNDQPAPIAVSKETITTAPRDPAPKQAQKVPAVIEDAAAPVTPAAPATGNNAQADTKTPSVPPTTTQSPASKPTADTATEDDAEASADAAPMAATDSGTQDFKLLLPSHLKQAAPTANKPWLPNSSNVGAWKAPSAAGALKALPPVVQPMKAKEAAKPKFNPQPLVNVLPIGMAQPQQPQLPLVNVQPVVATQSQQPQSSMQLQPPSAAAPVSAVAPTVPVQAVVPQVGQGGAAPTPVLPQAQNPVPVQVPVQTVQQSQALPQVQQPHVQQPQAQQPQVQQPQVQQPQAVQQVPAALPTLNRNIALSRPGFGPFSAGPLRTAQPSGPFTGYQAGQQQQQQQQSGNPGQVAGRFGGAPSSAAPFAARFTGEPRPTAGAHTANPEAHGVQPGGQPHGVNHMPVIQRQPAMAGSNNMGHNGPDAYQLEADVVVADPKAIADVFAEDSGGSGWKSLKPSTGAVDEDDFFAGAAGFRFVDPEPWYEAYDEWHDVPEGRFDDDEDRKLQRELRKLERDVDEYARESDKENGGKSGGKDDKEDNTEENILKKLGLKEPEQEVDNVMEFFKNLNIKPKDKKKKAYYYDPSEDKPKQRQHRKWDRERERERKPTYYELYAERDVEDAQSGASLMGQSTSKADKKASSKSSPISSKAPAARARFNSDSSKGVTDARTGDAAGGKQTGLDRSRQTSAKAHTHGEERPTKPNAPALSDSEKVKQMAKAAVNILGDKGWRMISINKAEDLEYIKAGVTEYNRNHKKPMFLLAWSP